eukprot:gb/GECH01013626.1/.p1 GENE.gb/GECH01013626.1/~~gb/GECH01013626.1/.p1  ORF type:complete len:202 (+),score=53.05 gb/GECH01013626.1/:1-606(+)
MITSDDLEQVKTYVSQLLNGLPQDLYYHGKSHTMKDVYPACVQLGREEGISEKELLLVATAALFHDTGFLDQYDKNEPFGAQRARDKLPDFGYTSDQIDIICQCIMATQMPQNPQNHLQKILCDADLGHLGTDNCFERAESLRQELNQRKGLDITADKWLKSNITFFEDHNYWTDAAKKLLKPKKEENLAKMKKQLNEKQE